jgi:hypothetical protein
VPVPSRRMTGLLPPGQPATSGPAAVSAPLTAKQAAGTAPRPRRSWRPPALRGPAAATRSRPPRPRASRPARTARRWRSLSRPGASSHGDRTPGADPGMRALSRAPEWGVSGRLAGHGDPDFRS